MKNKPEKTNPILICSHLLQDKHVDPSARNQEAIRLAKRKTRYRGEARWVG